MTLVAYVVDWILNSNCWMIDQELADTQLLSHEGSDSVIYVSM